MVTVEEEENESLTESRLEAETEFECVKGEVGDAVPCEGDTDGVSDGSSESVMLEDRLPEARMRERVRLVLSETETCWDNDPAELEMESLLDGVILSDLDPNSCVGLNVVEASSVSETDCVEERAFCVALHDIDCGGDALGLSSVTEYSSDRERVG